MGLFERVDMMTPELQQRSAAARTTWFQPVWRSPGPRSPISEPEARALDALDHTAVHRRTLEQCQVLAAPARRAGIIAGAIVTGVDGQKAEVGLKPAGTCAGAAEVAQLQRRCCETSEGLVGATEST